MILLNTKFHVPQPQNLHLSRHRLIEQLEVGFRRGNRLTLLVAPAGFGKTTLLSTWLTTYPHPVAWVSLDARDNLLSRFLFYLLSSLQPHLPGLEEAVLNFTQASQEPPAELILTTLLNAAARLEEPVLVVLEDYHLAGISQTDLALAYLLDHLSPKLHLVITSRQDPALPLSRLRVHDQLTELRAEDLRFTPEEVTAFLQNSPGPDLTSEQIAVLEARTEGWIAGLQLAVLSLKSHQDPEQFIASFGGSHRYIMDYLVDEVLNLQTEDIRLFLLQTAILKRLNGELCNALLNKQDARQTLERLETGNLFIVPLDNRRQWYRYHHLFAELLLYRLNSFYPAEVAQLHHRAGKWYAENSYWDEAIYHINLSNRVEELERLLAAAIEAHTLNNQLNLVLPWFDIISQQTLKQRPLLVLYQSWVLALAGQTELSAEYAELAQNLLSPESPSLDWEQGLLEAIRAYNARLQLNVPAALEHGHKALDLIGKQSPVIHNIMLMLIGQVKLLLPDFAGEGMHLVREALTTANTIGNRFGLYQSLSSIVFVLIAQARIREAWLLLDHYDKDWDSTGPDKTGSAEKIRNTNQFWIPALRATIYYLTNDLKKARAEIARIIKDEQSADGLELHSKAWPYIVRALIYSGEGQLHQALDIFRRLEAAGVALPPTIKAAPFKVNLLLKLGELEEPVQWIKAEDLAPTDVTSPTKEDYYLCYARVLTVQRRYEEALTLLKNLEDLESSLGIYYRLAQVNILQAIVYLKVQRHSAARDSLSKAVLLVAEPKLYRTFLDEDRVIYDLLVELRPVAPDFIRNLLGMYPQANPEKVEDSQPVTLLTQREQEVLDLMARGLSNREIGERLFLATGTVKRHAANISGKLEVKSRTGAIARARELGLF
ncbi:MAG: ATP-dependent transcriptional regulator [Chloroflexi bacterium]|nr:ATP-dependent transcriptional regulator [Chloroflexota bacterium]